MTQLRIANTGKLVFAEGHYRMRRITGSLTEERAWTVHSASAATQAKAAERQAAEQK
jgi:hypothetical protein